MDRGRRRSRSRERLPHRGHRCTRRKDGARLRTYRTNSRRTARSDSPSEELRLGRLVTCTKLFSFDPFRRLSFLQNKAACDNVMKRLLSRRKTRNQKAYEQGELLERFTNVASGCTRKADSLAIQISHVEAKHFLARRRLPPRAFERSEIEPAD